MPSSPGATNVITAEGPVTATAGSLAGARAGVAGSGCACTRRRYDVPGTSASRCAPEPGVSTVIVLSGGRTAPSTPSGSPYPLYAAAVPVVVPVPIVNGTRYTTDGCPRYGTPNSA